MTDCVPLSRYDWLEWDYDILHLFPFLSKYDCLEWNYDRLCPSQWVRLARMGLRHTTSISLFK